MFTGWFRRASVSDLLKASNANSETISYEDDLTTPSLKRVYKLTDLVYLGICNVVGSGIYVLAGTAGKYDAGPALLLSLVVGLISAGTCGLCYAEFASRIPVIGGDYVYIYASSGEMLGFLTGFVKIFNLCCSIAINAIGAAGYLRSFIQSLYNNNGDEMQQLNSSILFGKDIYGDIISISLLAPCIIFIFMCISLYDVGLSSKFMNIVATWNILLLVLFCAAGLMLMDYNLLIEPCNADVVETFGVECPSNANNSFIPFGFEGIIVAVPIAFWAVAGGENIASVAEESINPTRDIPKAIYITLTLVFILFELVTFVLFGMVPFQSLDETAPLSEAFAFHGELLLQRISAFGAFTTMTILLFAKILAASRYLYRISLDGLLCRWTAAIHPKRQTPFNATLVLGTTAMVIATFFDLAPVLSFAATIDLLGYTMVALGSLVMRYCPSSLEDSVDYIGYNENQNNIIEDSANRGDSYRSLSPNMNDIQLTEFWTDRRIFLLIWFYFILSLITGYIGFNYDYIAGEMELEFGWIVIMMICIGLLLIIFCVIVYLDVKLPWKDWIRGGRDFAKHITFVPLAPVSTLVVIVINACIIASSGLLMLCQVLALCILAFGVYVSYGYRHSKLGNKFRSALLEMK